MLNGERFVGWQSNMLRVQQPTNVVAIDALPGLWVQPALVLEVDAYGRRPSQKYIAGLADYGQGHELASVRASAKGLRGRSRSSQRHHD